MLYDIACKIVGRAHIFRYNLALLKSTPCKCALFAKIQKQLAYFTYSQIQNYGVSWL